MNKRLYIRNIILLFVSAVTLGLMWRFFLPPKAFVLSCVAAGAAAPILQRLACRLLAKTRQSLPLLFVIFFVIIPLSEYYYPSAHTANLFLPLGVFASAFCIGTCLVELALGPWFPLEPRERRT